MGDKSTYTATVLDQNDGKSVDFVSNKDIKGKVITCVDNGWLKVDPFVKFDLSREEVQTTFLIKKEIQAIAETVFVNHKVSHFNARNSVVKHG